jgi:hypothetical protein
VLQLSSLYILLSVLYLNVCELNNYPTSNMMMMMVLLTRYSVVHALHDDVKFHSHSGMNPPAEPCGSLGTWYRAKY